MIEFAGIVFSLGDIVGTFVALQAIGVLATIALYFKKGPKTMSQVSDELSGAVEGLDVAVNELVAAVDGYHAAMAVNDDEEVRKSLERVNAIADAIRAVTGRMKNVG